MKKNFIKIAGICLGMFALSRPAAAQLKIGNNGMTIDPSSILELENPAKALFLTRVALTSTVDVTTVPNPKAGMVVYNTNSMITSTAAHPAGTGGVGVYFFDGTAWIYSGSGIPTASNGLVDTANNIGLGGTLLHNTTINGGAFNTAITGNSTTSQSSAFSVTATPGNGIPQGGQIFGAQASVSGTDGAAASSNVTTLRAQVSQASTSGNNVRAQGSLNEGSSAGQGLGQYDQPQATGATGLADYTGTTNAGAADFITGLRGATYTSSNSINGLNVAGVTFDGNYLRSVGGYFYPTGGTVANLGTVGQVGGNVNQGWRDAALNNKNVGVVAINYNNGTPVAATASDLAIYASGNVQMANLPGTGNIVAIDASGNLSKTASVSAATVLTGSGPLYVSVPAGGTQDADINSAAFNTANPGDVVSVGVPPGQLSTYPGVTFFAFVKQSGIVTVRLFNTGNSAIGMGTSGAVYFGIVTAKVFQ